MASLAASKDETVLLCAVWNSSSRGDAGRLFEVRREVLSWWIRCAREEAVAAIARHFGWGTADECSVDATRVDRCWIVYSWSWNVTVSAFLRYSLMRVRGCCNSYNGVVKC